MSTFAICGVAFFGFLIVWMLWDGYKNRHINKIREHRRQVDEVVESKSKLIGYDSLPAKGTVEAPPTWPFPYSTKPEARKAPARTTSTVTTKRRFENPVADRKPVANDNTYIYDNTSTAATPAYVPDAHSHRHSESCASSHSSHSHSHSYSSDSGSSGDSGGSSCSSD